MRCDTASSQVELESDAPRESQDEREKHIQRLFTAELQFRLASAVRQATDFKTQPLDLPKEWTHGQHRVTYEEIALRPDQADYAAISLHRSSAFLMAVAMTEAFKEVVHDPSESADPVRAAYQIARLVRNAFAHGPFSPTWRIRPTWREVFEVPDVITLDARSALTSLTASDASRVRPLQPPRAGRSCTAALTSGPRAVLAQRQPPYFFPYSMCSRMLPIHSGPRAWLYAGLFTCCTSKLAKKPRKTFAL